MKKYILILLAAFLVGCGVNIKTSSSSVEKEAKRDSIYITHIDTMVIVKRDTIYKDRIVQSHDRVIVRADSSYLENEYCYTRASVSTDGLLSHSLDTRDSVMLPHRVEYKTRYISDTVFVELRNEKEKTESESKVRTVEVKKTTWWQRTQIIAFWVLLGVLAIIYRKKLYALVKKIVLWI